MVKSQNEGNEDSYGSPKRRKYLATSLQQLLEGGVWEWRAEGRGMVNRAISNRVLMAR